MKRFDWADLLRHHPIFSALSSAETQWLLEEDASDERDYPAGTIIHVDEVGEAVLAARAPSRRCCPLTAASRSAGSRARARFARGSSRPAAPASAAAWEA